jgi:hypothetical protein
MSILDAFATPAFIQEPNLDAGQQKQLNALWSVNVEGFTRQAITGDPWNNLNAPIQAGPGSPQPLSAQPDPAVSGRRFWLLRR